MRKITALNMFGYPSSLVAIFPYSGEFTMLDPTMLSMPSLSGGVN